MKLHQKYSFSRYFEGNYFGEVFTGGYSSPFRRNFSESKINFRLLQNEFSTFLYRYLLFFLRWNYQEKYQQRNKQTNKKIFYVFPSNFGISHDTEPLCVVLLFHSIFHLIPSFASFPLALCFNLLTQTQSIFSIRQLCAMPTLCSLHLSLTWLVYSL